MSDYDDMGSFLIDLGKILSGEHKSREDVQEQIKELGLNRLYTNKKKSPSEIVREALKYIKSDIDDVRLSLTASGVRDSLQEYNLKTNLHRF